MKETESRELGGGRVTGRGRRGRRGPRSTNATTILEQFVKRNATGLTFLGVTLGVFVSRKFLILPVAVALTMVQENLAAAGLERAARAVRR
jgi:hypothetical protein